MRDNGSTICHGSAARPVRHGDGKVLLVVLANGLCAVDISAHDGHELDAEALQLKVPDVELVLVELLVL